VARVLYPQGSADLQRIVNAVRTSLQLNRIPNQAVRAIMLRAANDRVAEAARIVDTLGR